MDPKDFTPDSRDWSGLLGGTLRLERPLRIALPCCGIMGTAPSFAQCEVPYEVVNTYDLEDTMPYHI